MKAFILGHNYMMAKIDYNILREQRFHFRVDDTVRKKLTSIGSGGLQNGGSSVKI